MQRMAVMRKKNRNKKLATRDPAPLTPDFFMPDPDIAMPALLFCQWHAGQIHGWCARQSESARQKNLRN